MDLFKLLGTIAVDNSGANSAIQETTDNASAMGSSFSDTLSSVGESSVNLGKKLAPVSLAASGAIAAVVGIGAKTASTTDNIDKMSQKLGISRTAYQEWDYIMSQNGASIDSMKMGMKTLTNIIDSVTTAGSTAGTSFERLGMSYDDLQGKTKEEIFSMTIEALQGCSDETEKAALANDLLGRSGQELAPLLNQTADSTEALRQKAHDLGMVLGDETINSGVEMTDTIDTMKRSFGAIVSEVGSAVMPLIKDFSQYLIDHMPQIRETVENLVEGFRNMNPVLKIILGSGLAIAAIASPFLITLGKIATGVSAMIKICGALNAVLMANPIILIIAAIAALIAGLVLLYKHCEGFREVVNNIFAFLKDMLAGVMDFFAGVVEFFGDLFTGAYEKITGVFSSIGGWFKDRYSDITSAFSNVGQWFSDTFSKAKDGIKNKFSDIGSWASGRFDAIKQGLGGVKDFFSNLFKSFKFPTLKLPHFSIKGSFSLDPPSIPSLSVKWYKKAMNNAQILDSASIFGMDAVSGQLLGGGEAGSEVVAGSSTLMGMIRGAVSDAIGNINTGEPEESVMYATINTNLDGKRIASELYNVVIDRITKEQAAKLRAVGV